MTTRNDKRKAAAEHNELEKRVTALFDDDALVCYCPPTPALDVPAACYTFVQRGRGIETKRFREEAEAQDVIEATYRAQVVVTASDAGYFFSDIV